MKIQSIKNQTFGSEKSYGICKKYPNSFMTMSVDDKLDVIYGMLKEQKEDLITLSQNQYKIQSCNDNASMAILNSFNHGMGANGKITAQIGNTFDANRIDIIA